MDIYQNFPPSLMKAMECFVRKHYSQNCCEKRLHQCNHIKSYFSGQCFDLFCNWNTTEKQANSEWAKFQCCLCAKKLNLWNKEEEVLKSRTPLEDTDFDRETQPVRCPWPGNKHLSFLILRIFCWFCFQN